MERNKLISSARNTLAEIGHELTHEQILKDEKAMDFLTIVGNSPVEAKLIENIILLKLEQIENPTAKDVRLLIKEIFTDKYKCTDIDASVFLIYLKINYPDNYLVQRIEIFESDAEKLKFHLVLTAKPLLEKVGYLGLSDDALLQIVDELLPQKAKFKELKKMLKDRVANDGWGSFDRDVFEKILRDSQIVSKYPPKMVLALCPVFAEVEEELNNFTA